MVVAVVVCAGAIFTTGCTHGSRSQGSGRVEAPQAESIGIARMEADGTIVLQLRAVEGGILGETLVRYPKDHPEYSAVLKHLGGLRPGETKPVPPWPDRK